jgi:prevent-host-death family protein
MAIRTLTSREFNQDTSGAKRAAKKGPVFITDRGRPAHVLLTMEDYQRLNGTSRSLLQAVAQTGKGADFDFSPPRLQLRIDPADLD